MAYQEIDLGTTGNDGTGDDARAGGAKINAQFKELFSRSFLLDEWLVIRRIWDPNALSFDAFLDGDKIEGFADVGETRWIEGIMLDVTGFTFPDDLDDPAKFFITNERYTAD